MILHAVRGDDEIGIWRERKLLTPLVAGQETIAGTLAWAAERLCRDASLQRRVRTVFGGEREKGLGRCVHLRAASHATGAAVVGAMANEAIACRLTAPTREHARGRRHLPHASRSRRLRRSRLRHTKSLSGRTTVARPFVRRARRWSARFPGGACHCSRSELCLHTCYDASRWNRHERDERWRRSGITYVPAEGALVCLSVADGSSGGCSSARTPPARPF